MPISLVRNKRKSCEPSKVVSERSHEATLSQTNGPLKKRIRYTSNSDSGVLLTPTDTYTSPSTAATVTTTSPSPFCGWDSSQALPHELMPNPAEVFVRHPGVTTLHRLPLDIFYSAPEQDEPLALVLDKSPNRTDAETRPVRINKRTPSLTTTSLSSPTRKEHKEHKSITSKKRRSSSLGTSSKRACQEALSLTSSSTAGNSSAPVQPATMTPMDILPLVICAQPNSYSSSSCESPKLLSADVEKFSSSLCETSVSGGTISPSSSSSVFGVDKAPSHTLPQTQRNYKNMTRERRIEANARERSRVHTISAAYETLRRAVPSYSSNQKLSKLSVLRVACSYILTLSRLAGYDYSQDESAPAISSCFDAVTATIQTEGKLRKKKDE